MIYVSSSCSSKNNIRESILELINCGINNIELSGGTEYYSNLEEDLINLQETYNIKFLLHNYFPPPKEHFVLNLASNNNTIRDNSLKHIQKALLLSEKLGADKYGIHAGFLIDPDKNELGKKIDKKTLIPEELGKSNFMKGLAQIKNTNRSTKLYVENNVLSEQNFKNYGCNPFMLTHKDAFLELKKNIEFNLLLDVAHLKVSCKSMGLNFIHELKFLSSQTDYLHISDNDGLSDSNLEIKKNSELFNVLQECDLRNKTISLEIYSGLNRIVESIELIRPLVEE
jgi:sugar phosphate isomerase/epimerase